MSAEPEANEKVIEMRMQTSGPRRARERARFAGRFAVLCLVLLLAPAAVASAAVQWQVTSAHGPQNFIPGEDGQYVLQVYNIGDADSSGTVTVTDALPPGVTATAAHGDGWTCPGLPATTVTCTTTNTVQPPGSVTGTAANQRGAAPALFVDVTADGGASNTSDNDVTVSGGGAAAPASDTDPTPFSFTPAGFGFVPGTFLADAFDAQEPAGVPVRQAGGHPFEVRFDFDLDLTRKTDPELGAWTEPDGYIKTIDAQLPQGLIGNPQATPQCTIGELVKPASNRPSCPTNSQVGSIDLIVNSGTQIESTNLPNLTLDLPVFNVAPPPGYVAAFGFSILGNPVMLLASLDPTNNYAVVTRILYTNDVFQVRSSRLTLWGVPADPAHDKLRFDPNGAFGHEYGVSSTAPIKPFMTMPFECGVAGATRISIDSWQNPGQFVSAESAPASMTGCDDSRFQFHPSISVRPDTLTPDSPTGLNVDLTVPQKDDTAATASDLYPGSGRDIALNTPPVRTVSVTLPDGMVVSPSSANGLASCSPSQINLGSDAPVTCPDAAKIGTAELQTPLLGSPVDGSVYLASQNDNPFGSTLALYIVLRDDSRGLLIKLPGKVAPDPVTGQLTTTFDENPEVPFSSLHVHFKGGPRAPLVTPATCGLKTATAQISSWNASLPAAPASDSFTIAGGSCAPRGFDPGFVAGSADPVAGKDSPIVTRFSRGDGDEQLSAIDVSLPKGLLGRIASVELCPDANANAGTCTDASRIASVTVAAGPGSDPVYISGGRAYITGPYKGAPFGLSFVVPAKAGPFDLGDVVVRAQIQVDRTTAALRVVSDPLPTILDGIPLDVRLVDVNVDRSSFTFNPTNCRPTSASATIAATNGATATKTSSFDVTGCKALPFKPKMTLRVGRKHRTGNGASTPLVATVQMTSGQANLAGVRVTLPTTLNARLPVVNRACTMDQFHAGHCEAARAGTAVAVTPLLRDPLRGSVYFVKNGRPLPDMFVALRGQVDVDLDGRVAIPGGKHLATDFNAVPDVPISSFKLSLVDGSHGPVGAAANLCSARAKRATAGLVFTAQSGKVVRRLQRLQIVGCPKAKKTSRAHRRK